MTKNKITCRLKGIRHWIWDNICKPILYIIVWAIGTCAAAAFIVAALAFAAIPILVGCGIIIFLAIMYFIFGVLLGMDRR